MLSSHGERWRVLEAVRLGVNEYLRKPVSAHHLLERLISILAKPRPIVQVGDYYGPEPRRGLAETMDDTPLVAVLEGSAVSGAAAVRSTAARSLAKTVERPAACG